MIHNEMNAQTATGGNNFEALLDYLKGQMQADQTAPLPLPDTNRQLLERLHFARRHGIHTLAQAAAQKIAEAAGLQDGEAWKARMLDGILDAMLSVYCADLLERGVPRMKTEGVRQIPVPPASPDQDRTAALPTPGGALTAGAAARTMLGRLKAASTRPARAAASRAEGALPAVLVRAQAIRLKAGATGAVAAAGGLREVAAQPVTAAAPDPAALERQALADYVAHAGKCFLLSEVMTTSGRRSLPEPTLFYVVENMQDAALLRWDGQRLTACWQVWPLGKAPGPLSAEKPLWVEARRYFPDRPAEEGWTMRPIWKDMGGAQDALAALAAAEAAGGGEDEPDPRLLEARAEADYAAHLGRCLEVSRISGLNAEGAMERVRLSPPLRVRVIATAAADLRGWSDGILAPTWRVEVLEGGGAVAHLRDLRIEAACYTCFGELLPSLSILSVQPVEAGEG